MEVQNPRRILAVALDSESHHLSRIINDITGSIPSPINGTLAGISHDLSLTTAYYTATVPIWLDLTSVPADWSATFLSEEAKEVLEALGGLVVVFSTGESPKGTAGELLRHVGRVVGEGLGGWGWDGVALALGVGEVETYLDEWDEVCAEMGLEFVSMRGGEKDKGVNEFGEKKGAYRAIEALQANNWETAAGDEDDGEDDLFDLDADNLDFAMGDPSDFAGLRQAIWSEMASQEAATKAMSSPVSADNTSETTKGESADGGKEGAKVGGVTGITAADSLLPPEEEALGMDEMEKLERMMGRLKATRELGEGLPEGERKRMVKKVILEVMKELE